MCSSYVWMIINHTYPQGTLQAFDSFQICHRIQTYPAYAWWPGIVKLCQWKNAFSMNNVQSGCKYVQIHFSCTQSLHKGLESRASGALSPDALPEQLRINMTVNCDRRFCFCMCGAGMCCSPEYSLLMLGRLAGQELLMGRACWDILWFPYMSMRLAGTGIWGHTESRGTEQRSHFLLFRC